jgi:hypothetical protein
MGRRANRSGSIRPILSAVNISGGITADKRYVYLAGAFRAIWMFSIGRTSLFQDVWQIKIAELRAQHPDDPRFSVLDTRDAQKKVRPLSQTFGAVPSKWYLLFSPLIFTLAWLVILIRALM